MDAQALVQAVQQAATARGLRGLGSSWRIRRADRAVLARSRKPVRARVPGTVVRVEPEPGGGTLQFARSQLRVRVAVGGAVFLGWDGAEPSPSYAVAEDGCPPVDTRVRLESDTAGGWRVVSERVLVTVARHGTVEIRTPGGLLLRRDEPPRWWEPVDGGQGQWMQRSEVATDADVFGLGGRAVGPRLPEGAYRLWNVEGDVREGAGFPTPMAMPVRLVVASVGSHLVFHDNTWDGELTVRHGRAGEGSGHDRPGRCTLSMKGGPVRYWVLPGPPSRALRGWSRLIGGTVVPPPWALGYQLAVERWDAEGLADLVGDWQRRGLAPRALHLGARGGTTVGATAGTEEAIDGESRSLTEAVHRLGARVVRGVSPRVAVRPGEEWYDRGHAEQVFVREAVGERPVVGREARGEVAYPDFTARGTRTWWAEAWPRLLGGRAAGVWHEPYEPAPHGTWGREVLPLAAQHVLEGARGDHREAHNVMGSAVARATHEALQAVEATRSVALFSSGGWVGVQRHGGVLLRVPEGWEGLRAAVSSVLGLGLSGVPLAGADVPGPLSTELGVRGMQLGAWLPLFRTSAARVAPLTGWAETEGGRVLAGLVAERERLLPYWCTLAAVASGTGAPMARPVWWGSPSDRSLRRESDTFLLGDVFLVAPVCEPGSAYRDLRLPRGSWYDTATGEVFRGPGLIRVAAPLSRIPVFARAGAVVPVKGEDGGVVLEVWAPRPGVVGSGLYIPPPGDGDRMFRGETDRRPRRYTVRLLEGAVTVAREDGRPLGCEVRVRARGA